jgi:hypothetical protein
MLAAFAAAIVLGSCSTSIVTLAPDSGSADASPDCGQLRAGCRPFPQAGDPCCPDRETCTGEGMGCLTVYLCHGGVLVADGVTGPSCPGTEDDADDSAAEASADSTTDALEEQGSDSRADGPSDAPSD